MKWIYAILIIVQVTTLHAQVTVSVQWQKEDKGGVNDTTFYAKNRKLEWKDFRGRPDVGSDAAAITASGFGYLLAMHSINRRTSFVVSVYCFYDKQHSWVKPGMQSDYALLHEQHHFDITYINTCAFMEKLRTARFSLSNYREVIDRIYSQSYNALENMQNDYDGQTKNGQLKSVQLLWNKKVDADLFRIIRD